ncbi:NAD(P)-dependent oxidoreductase [Microbacterium enclense]|uniref:NAD(P)-dependent oxidoreductase n=1 Tax=Microbacterium enclense TaxID=993073 RepID=A0A3S3LI23_9MICO|nr:NAD(P)-dependent oxidoreductase [Microbacterium enclense]RWR16802.1 NAD(P)-dependent oxidoreductase [Microbacterium enclense]
MSRIIVTGGAGRLGRALVAGLTESGHEVVSVDRVRSVAPELSNATQVAVDLSDAVETETALRRLGGDALVHLAAIAVPFSAPEDVILRTNSALAMSVLGGAVAAGIPRIIGASSPTVIGYGAPTGWVPDRLPIDEDTEPRPWNAYALSKLVIEQTLQMLRRQTGDSTRYAAFRPCYVIAPEEWAGAPTQQGHSVRQRLDDPALSAPALFNYVDARDVAHFVDLLIAGIDDIPNAETFFVGAADALAREPLAGLLPRFVPGSDRAAAVLTGTAPAFRTEKARDLLGWVPTRSWRTELADHPTDPDR